MGVFTPHCVSKRNLIYEERRFNRWNQERHEYMESFITPGHTLAEHCQFGNLRGTIVDSMRDVKLSESLQLDAVNTGKGYDTSEAAIRK